MRCPNCSSNMTFRVLEEYELGPTLGLSSVLVRKLPAFACTSCDDVLVPGPALEGVSAAVLREMLIHSFPLRGIDVRFLRKAVGLTQIELASRLGVDRVSVARWESAEDKALAGPECIAVRAVVGAAEGSPVRAQPVEVLRHAPEPQRRCIELEAPPSSPPPM